MSDVIQNPLLLATTLHEQISSPYIFQETVDCKERQGEDPTHAPQAQNREGEQQDHQLEQCQGSPTERTGGYQTFAIGSSQPAGRPPDAPHLGHQRGHHRGTQPRGVEDGDQEDGILDRFFKRF